jgi:hypothetical protein
MSSHTEFRAQLVRLSPGSYYSISAMLEPRVFEKRADPPSAPAPPPVTASRVAARRPPTHHATRTARMRVLAVPVGRRWLFQDFSLRRLLPGAARSVDMGTILLLFAFNNNANNNNIFQRARCGSTPLRSKCSARCCARCTPGRTRTHGALIRNSTAQARIHMTRGWAVESGGSTSCEWKVGGNAACSALVNCPTVHEAAKWDSPHCPRQRRR